MEMGIFVLFKPKPAYEVRMSDWISDVCSSDLHGPAMTQPLTLTFNGAARTVTGSCHEFVFGKTRVVVDCGMFQGSRTLEGLNASPFGFNPRHVDAVVLTHAHIDHSGLLPRLAAEGFSGDRKSTRLNSSH